MKLGWKIIIGLLIIFPAIIGIILIDYRTQLRHAHEDNLKLRQEIIDISSKYDNLKDTIGFTGDTESIYVSMTAYNPVKGQTDSTPHITANGDASIYGTIAVSRDLISHYNIALNDVVVLEGYGMFRVTDTMNERWKKRIDIMVPSKKAAIVFGNKRYVKLIFERK